MSSSLPCHSEERSDEGSVDVHVDVIRFFTPLRYTQNDRRGLEVHGTTT